MTIDLDKLKVLVKWQARGGESQALYSPSDILALLDRLESAEKRLEVKESESGKADAFATKMFSEYKEATNLAAKRLRTVQRLQQKLHKLNNKLASKNEQVQRMSERIRELTERLESAKREAERKPGVFVTSAIDCQADRDGDCHWKHCPQLRDGEPKRSGRHCPHDTGKDPYE